MLPATCRSVPAAGTRWVGLAMRRAETAQVCIHACCVFFSSLFVNFISPIVAQVAESATTTKECAIVSRGTLATCVSTKTSTSNAATEAVALKLGMREYWASVCFPESVRVFVCV